MPRRIVTVAVLAAFAVAGPIAVAQGASSKSKVARGVVFGAVTAQDFPVVIELSKTGRKIVRASIGLDLKCGTPDVSLTIPDGVTNVPVSAAGKFIAEQPVTRSPAAPDGTPAFDYSATFKGTVNKARTRIKGSWQRKLVLYNPADPTATQVLDSCDTGVLSFTAKN